MVQRNHALVIGASGLAGWGVVNELLSGYPNPGAFVKVTALTNRPINVAESCWPSPADSESELNLISGVNLLEGDVEQFTKALAELVPRISEITHIYYFAFKQDNNPATEVDLNHGMFERIIEAVNILSPNLKFVVFPSGSKAYGIQETRVKFQAPFIEAMIAENESWQSATHYPTFRKLLKKQSEGKSWTWCEVLPDAIIGFSPNGSTFNLTAHWANYLSTYAVVEGLGSKVPYPGSNEGFKSRFNEASSSIIAKFSIYASLHPETCGNGRIFNIADNSHPESMEIRWPQICKYFGLEGVAPIDNGKGRLLPGEYVNQHIEVLEAKAENRNVVFRGDFLDSYGFYLSFDRWFDIRKVRDVGFMEEIQPYTGWTKAFDMFKKAGMI